MKTKTLVLILIAVVVIGIGIFLLANSARAAMSFADDASPVMYFYQESCVHCQAMKPILNELAGEGYRLKIMDAGTHAEYWTQYNISGTPTWVAANGDRLVGEQGKDDLRAWLDKHNAKIAAK